MGSRYWVSEVPSTLCHLPPNPSLLSLSCPNIQWFWANNAYQGEKICVFCYKSTNWNKGQEGFDKFAESQQADLFPNDWSKHNSLGRHGGKLCLKLGIFASR